MSTTISDLSKDLLLNVFGHSRFMPSIQLTCRAFKALHDAHCTSVKLNWTIADRKQTAQLGRHYTGRIAQVDLNFLKVISRDCGCPALDGMHTVANFGFVK